LAKTYLNMPGLGSIAGRISSITNSFVGALIPFVEPTDEHIREALRILKMPVDDIRCAYCGDVATEWDHLRPLVQNKLPTGYVSEIGNLVPACGKCNQSKGNKPWQDWINSTARFSPRTRKTKDLETRIRRLREYESWRPRQPLDFKELVGEEMWRLHWENHRRLVEAMRESQRTADELRHKIERSGAI
jgi:5-methylcytosine-specific restriction endonuclease McrA